jgi:hypothetical protein
MRGIWQRIYEFKEKLRAKRTQNKKPRSRIEEEGVELKLKSGEVNAPPWIGRGSDTLGERRNAGKVTKENVFGGESK